MRVVEEGFQSDVGRIDGLRRYPEHADGGRPGGARTLERCRTGLRVLFPRQGLRKYSLPPAGAVPRFSMYDPSLPVHGAQVFDRLCVTHVAGSVVQGDIQHALVDARRQSIPESRAVAQMWERREDSEGGS